MLRQTFNLFLPYRVVIYLRMSDEGQNPRSPDQQLAEIKQTMTRLGVRWEIVKVYRDDAISGRFSRKRQNYQLMLRELKCGSVKADLVLVDTFERLTREDEGDAVRARLRKLGLLVLTANSNFTDPTSTAGRALGMVESIRASEDGKVKAHNVLRGKKDAVRLKHWPGGPVPFGFRLRPVLAMVNGFEVVSHHVPEPDPSIRWIVEEIFRLADELGYGTSRIAKALNNDPRIPEELKPFHPATVGENLDNTLYFGEYTWGKNCTGIVDDVRVLQPLPEEEWLRITDYCEGIVSRELWGRVQAIRMARRTNRSKGSSGTESCNQQLVGLNVPGLALKYPLSGLTRCVHCNRRMIAQSSSVYVTASGEERRYVGYACAGLAGGLCHNATRVPEAWLRETVMGLLRKRLHLDDCDPSSPALLEFIDLVRRELSVCDIESPDLATALLSEKSELEDRCRGWLQTLGNPSLSPVVRGNVEAELEKAQLRIRLIAGSHEERLARQQHRESILDPQTVVDRLQQLATVLNGSNLSAMNVMLSHHIDTIWCDKDGVVTIRTCKLGALTGDLDLFVGDGTELQAPATAGGPARFVATPRRRGRLDIGGAIEDDESAADANDFAVDTNRFAGLGPEWFHDDVFTVPESVSWAEANAMLVAEYRLTTRSSMELTANHFEKSVPTIRSALQYAKEIYGIDAFGKSISRSTLPNWPRDHATEVVDYFRRPGASMNAAMAHFGRSDTTIRKALRFANTSPTNGDTADSSKPAAIDRTDDAAA